MSLLLSKAGITNISKDSIFCLVPDKNNGDNTINTCINNLHVREGENILSYDINKTSILELKMLYDNINVVDFSKNPIKLYSKEFKHGDSSGIPIPFNATAVCYALAFKEADVEILQQSRIALPLMFLKDKNMGILWGALDAHNVDTDNTIIIYNNDYVLGIIQHKCVWDEYQKELVRHSCGITHNSLYPSNKQEILKILNNEDKVNSLLEYYRFSVEICNMDSPQPMTPEDIHLGINIADYVYGPKFCQVYAYYHVDEPKLRLPLLPGTEVLSFSMLCDILDGIDIKPIQDIREKLQMRKQAQNNAVDFVNNLSNDDKHNMADLQVTMLKEFLDFYHDYKTSNGEQLSIYIDNNIKNLIKDIILHWDLKQNSRVYVDKYINEKHIKCNDNVVDYFSKLLDDMKRYTDYVARSIPIDQSGACVTLFESMIEKIEEELLCCAKGK